MTQYRTVLTQDLKELRSDILRLSSMVDEAISRAMTALENRDVQLAQQVVQGDTAVNELRYKIESDAMRILATQFPAASDLRSVLAGLFLSNELERIGDHAAGIARLVERMEEEEPLDSLHKLPKMCKRARKMVEEGILAYVNCDPEQAWNMIRRDDKIDKQYNKLVREALLEMRDDAYIQRATYLIWVGHNLERIGDRATNIAERVIFMCTGEYVEIMSDPEEPPFLNQANDTTPGENPGAST